MFRGRRALATIFSPRHASNALPCFTETSFYQNLYAEDGGIGLNGILFTFRCRNGKKYAMYVSVSASSGVSDHFFVVSSSNALPLFTGTSSYQKLNAGDGCVGLNGIRFTFRCRNERSMYFGRWWSCQHHDGYFGCVLVAI